jgi:hemin uptake protein HemP
MRRFRVNPNPQGTARDSSSESARMISSQDILKGEKQVIIEHRGEQYRLILTKNDKLVLHK